MERDAAADFLRIIDIHEAAREATYSIKDIFEICEIAECWIREAQAQRERAERAERYLAMKAIREAGVR